MVKQKQSVQKGDAIKDKEFIKFNRCGFNSSELHWRTFLDNSCSVCAAGCGGRDKAAFAFCFHLGPWFPQVAAQDEHKAALASAESLLFGIFVGISKFFEGDGFQERWDWS